MPQFLRRGVVPFAILFCIFVAAGVVGGFTFPPDVAAVQELQEWRTRSPQLTLGVIALTQLGSIYATFGVGLAAAAWLFFTNQRWRGTVIAITVVGERLLVDGLKLALDRARPAFDAHPVMTNSSSFPSGHAGNTMAVFLTIALVAAPPRLRRPAVTLALILTGLVGLSRPYLGVHWPSDIVGGWALGAMVAMAAAKAASRDKG